MLTWSIQEIWHETMEIFISAFNAVIFRSTFPFPVRVELVDCADIQLPQSGNLRTTFHGYNVCSVYSACSPPKVASHLQLFPFFLPFSHFSLFHRQSDGIIIIKSQHIQSIIDFSSHNIEKRCEHEKKALSDWKAYGVWGNCMFALRNCHTNLNVTGSDVE